MSKLYNTYIALKKDNPSILYLFKSGIFFISIDADAKTLSKLFNFKITNLNSSCIKCGFPEKRLEYYSKLLEQNNVPFAIVNSCSTKAESYSKYISNANFDTIIKTLCTLDMNDITCRNAFNILFELSEKAKSI